MNMTILEEKEAGYITLKEASEQFGYSPDYIGQLIRKGKISGKQVYLNVAWVTTPEAMQEYILKEKNKKNVDDEQPKTGIMDKTLDAVDFDSRLDMFRFILRGIIVVLLFFIIFILSVVLNAVPHDGTFHWKWHYSSDASSLEKDYSRSFSHHVS